MKLWIERLEFNVLSPIGQVHDYAQITYANLGDVLLTIHSQVPFIRLHNIHDLSGAQSALWHTSCIG